MSLPVPTPGRPPMNLREWGMILTLAAIWGGSFFFVEIALAAVPPFTIVACRVGIAALILFAVLRLRGQTLSRDPVIWTAFLVMGLLNNAIPFSLIVWGQSHIASGLAAILNATTPLFTVVVAHFLTSDERLTPARSTGVVIGLIGVCVMIGGEALAELGVAILAQTACVAAALSYAFAGVFGRRFRTLGLSPMATATGQVIASTCLLVPMMLIVDRPWTLPVPSMDAILALIALAALCTAGAYLLYFRILATAGATNLALVTFLVPVTAILLGVLMLGETLQKNEIFGMAMIGLGLAALDGRPARWILTPLRQKSHPANLDDEQA